MGAHHLHRSLSHNTLSAKRKMDEDTLRDETQATVQRHIAELRVAVHDGVISPEDHDLIGFIFSNHLGHLLGLSDAGWETFTRMVTESREALKSRKQEEGEEERRHMKRMLRHMQEEDDKCN